MGGKGVSSSMRPLPSRISNAHGERLLDDLTQARIDERRKMARKLRDGVGHELSSAAELANEIHGSLASDHHCLADQMGSLALAVEKAMNDIHAMERLLDPNFRELTPVASEEKNILQQPHGQPYRILGERIPQREIGPSAGRLFAL